MIPCLFTRQWARSWSWKHSQHLLVLPSVHFPTTLQHLILSHKADRLLLSFKMKLHGWNKWAPFNLLHRLKKKYLTNIHHLFNIIVPKPCQIFHIYLPFIQYYFAKTLSSVCQIFNKNLIQPLTQYNSGRMIYFRENSTNVKMKWKEFIVRLTYVVDAKYYGSIFLHK